MFFSCSAFLQYDDVREGGGLSYEGVALLLSPRKDLFYVNSAPHCALQFMQKNGLQYHYGPLGPIHRAVMISKI